MFFFTAGLYVCIWFKANKQQPILAYLLLVFFLFFSNQLMYSTLHYIFTDEIQLTHTLFEVLKFGVTSFQNILNIVTCSLDAEFRGIQMFSES